MLASEAVARARKNTPAPDKMAWRGHGGPIGKRRAATRRAVVFLRAYPPAQSGRGAHTTQRKYDVLASEAVACARKNTTARRVAARRLPMGPPQPRHAILCCAIVVLGGGGGRRFTRATLAGGICPETPLRLNDETKRNEKNTVAKAETKRNETKRLTQLANKE